jgi:acid stress chaperone HdeB
MMGNAMRTLATVLCLAAIVANAPPVQAQVTLDMTKVTCDQWSGYKITNPQNIALWLSGYHSAKRGNTLIDTQGLLANTQKLRDFCITNPQLPVMQAVEKVFGQ